MSRARSAPPDLPGFTLVEGIGSGGFADVFLFTQHHPSRPVAVKVLRAEYVSDSSLRQFANEANVMAQVSEHPYIVTIHASGIAPDGRPYIVMEHYPGEHFGIRARGGRLSVAEVLRVGVQVASAVETAHRAGILHRDIKPANILTSSYGRPGLTDFGIASVATEGAEETAPGMTLAFSAAEVLLDPDHTGSEASDLYSLAATIFSLLTGHSPFWVPGGDNTEPALIARVASRAVPRLTRPDVPPSLAHLLANGMAAEPADRPPSAVAFARALQSIEQELSLAPTPIEVRDENPTTSGVAARDWTAVDEDGTRRAGPRIVSPDPTPPPVPPAATGSVTPAVAPAPAVPPPAVVVPTVAPPADPPVAGIPGPVPAPAGAVAGASPWAPGAPAPHVPPPPTSGFEDDPETLMKRPSPPVAPRPTAADRLRGADGGPNLILIGAVAVAVLVVLSVAVVLLTRGDEVAEPTGPDPGVTTPTVVVEDPPDAPDDIAATLDPTGTLSVSFVAETTTPAPTFRLIRARGTWPDGPWVDTTETSATIAGLDPATPVCFTVATIVGGTISDPSAEVCAAPAPAPTEPPPTEPVPTEGAPTEPDPGAETPP